MEKWESMPDLMVWMCGKAGKKRQEMETYTFKSLPVKGKTDSMEVSGDVG